MFIVFNKQKIYSYLVALSTVVILFVIAFAVTNKQNDVLQTSTNMQQENINNSVVVNQNNQMTSSENISITNKVDNTGNN